MYRRWRCMSGAAASQESGHVSGSHPRDKPEWIPPCAWSLMKKRRCRSPDSGKSKTAKTSPSSSYSSATMMCRTALHQLASPPPATEKFMSRYPAPSAAARSSTRSGHLGLSDLRAVNESPRTASRRSSPGDRAGVKSARSLNPCLFPRIWPMYSTLPSVSRAMRAGTSVRR